MQEVSCASCGNRVLVEKYSPVHTSVQWLDDAERVCPEFAARAAQGEHSKWIPTCPKLRASIEAAVERGEVATDSPRSYPVPGVLG
ncbi:hypothetical protein G4X40_06255 [Rhodococcus sp. D2-41]|uniref:Ferredoxin n=1 Tax=Speluncibacter jeojiensis TaxID=2710754 RepID=A0A9X4RGX9_9ACTN|nr:hypothetical protein [Rhodococcus sp. D2-41]MDG3009747.1 hypothetical protein [Rhodococcus sp. D2-41]MDG3014496.1 hypothetical protein [Corynebacteriales bacterium D3-21]